MLVYEYAALPLSYIGLELAQSKCPCKALESVSDVSDYTPGYFLCQAICILPTSCFHHSMARSMYEERVNTWCIIQRPIREWEIFPRKSPRFMYQVTQRYNGHK